MGAKIRKVFHPYLPNYSLFYLHARKKHQGYGNNCYAQPHIQRLLGQSGDKCVDINVVVLLESSPMNNRFSTKIRLLNPDFHEKNILYPFVFLLLHPLRITLHVLARPTLQQTLRAATQERRHPQLVPARLRPNYLQQPFPQAAKQDAGISFGC